MEVNFILLTMELKINRQMYFLVFNCSMVKNK